MSTPTAAPESSVECTLDREPSEFTQLQSRNLLRIYWNLRIYPWAPAPDHTLVNEFTLESIPAKFLSSFQSSPPSMNMLLSPLKSVSLVRANPQFHASVRFHLGICFRASSVYIRIFLQIHPWALSGLRVHSRSHSGLEFTLESTPAHESTPKPALVYELTPELASSHESTPELTELISLVMSPFHSMSLVLNLPQFMSVTQNWVLNLWRWWLLLLNFLRRWHPLQLLLRWWHSPLNFISSVPAKEAVYEPSTCLVIDKKVVSESLVCPNEAM